jgi:type IV secretory pathway protease TraF
MSARCATVFTTIAATGLLLSTIGGTNPLCIWNASNSAPKGLYRLQPEIALSVTELMAAQPADVLATFLDLDGYLPIGVPMVKRVVALPGQTICRNDLSMASRLGRRTNATGEGVRSSLAWMLIIADGDVFVMNWQPVGSLDSRYLGSLLASAVIGRAVSAWTDEP